MNKAHSKLKSPVCGTECAVNYPRAFGPTHTHCVVLIVEAALLFCSRLSFPKFLLVVFFNEDYVSTPGEQPLNNSNEDD